MTTETEIAALLAYPDAHADGPGHDGVGTDHRSPPLV
jgi:hypothetical protein